MRFGLAATMTGLAVLFTLPPIAQAQRPPSCCGTQQATIVGYPNTVMLPLFNFTADSILRYGDGALQPFEFQRYVWNHRRHILRVHEWESTGIYKAYINAGECASICFVDTSGLYVTPLRRFVYGTRRIRRDQRTVLAAFEAQGTEYSPQIPSPPPGATVLRQTFDNLDAMAALLARREDIVLESSAHVAVPAHPQALERLLDGNPLQYDFASLHFSIAERLTLVEGIPYGVLSMTITVDDFTMLKLMDRRVAPIRFSASDSRVTTRLLSNESVVLHDEVVTFYDRAPQPLVFPVRRTLGTVQVEVGQNQARMNIPFGVASGRPE